MIEKVILLLLLLVGCVLSQSTGVKTSISLEGIHYAAKVGLPIVEKKLNNLHIPDIATVAKTPVGEMNITVSNIGVFNFSIVDLNTTFVPSDSISLFIDDIIASVSLSWSYSDLSFHRLQDQGTADINISKTSFGILISIGEINGQPTANVSQCSVSIGQLDIETHGGESWFYQFFINLFSGLIKSEVEKEIEKALPPIINSGLSSAISTLPITVAINDEIEINYELTEQPSVSSSYLTFSALGEFYSLAKPTPAPFSPGPIPSTTTSDMIQIYVSDFTINSASYVFFEEGLMKYEVNDSMLPSNSPLRLNTTYFSILIPPLEKAYPDRMFKLNIYAAATPTVTFSASGAAVNAIVNVDFVILPELDVAFTLQLKALGDGEVSLSGTNIVGKVAFINATLSLNNTNIGDFSILALQEIMSTLVQQLVLPQANKKLAVGFPLPTIAGLTLEESEIGFGANYVLISTDFTYQPNFTDVASTNERKHTTVHVI